MQHHMIAMLTLIAVTVAIHASGSVALIRMLEAYLPFWRRHPSFVVGILSLSWVVASLVILHMFEIGVWATYLFLRGLFPDFETATYFSLVTYTTTGFGDVTLPKEWRILGSSQALVGILMTSWSIAILIAVVTGTYKEDRDRSIAKTGVGQT
ncbi:MAG TPA: ion channel [Thermoanaerobaculaceae bacterium]|nr:ion channel [Thermoanaerobaculaceae bacterium]